MGVSYNKLFKLMIDKKIRKGQLSRAAGISSGSLLMFLKKLAYCRLDLSLGTLA